MKIKIVLITLLVASCSSKAFLERPFFNTKKDILIAQFDSKPDPDDLHAQAALGCMLLHKDLNGVNYYAVAGAIGIQEGNFIDSSSLLNIAFGNNWTNAHKDWEAAVENITNKVVSILKEGGKVWVQEAGQSNITADWILEVLKIIPEATVKSNIIIVQHSKWNEDHADSKDLEYVKTKTTYFAIDDGNMAFASEEKDRGIYSTPGYRSKDKKWMLQAKTSSNIKARVLWTEAYNLIDKAFPNKFPHEWSDIHYDGVDYSDCVENWWIFNIEDQANSHAKFWNRYVLN
ncbi:hypothetical protein [uncultured Algibacter sp.]|uniref:hypothetical protein n=1 Tax=uncultured Algibacter sp. TaxID=298659 RepID=UPI00263642E7|nr:hypothetical protein [uncultured Algibacter sp.]